MSAILDTFFIIVIIFLFLVLLSIKYGSISDALTSVSQLIQQSVSAKQGASTTAISNGTHVTVIAVQKMNQSSLANYVLGLINRDRAQYGIAPVSLSDEPSAQQHSESMLYGGYFSHWDLSGLKPYMRYTLSGGNGSVTENIAYESEERCGILGCTGTINPNQSLQNMEYNMMYNDSICCNNGHRDNILNPNHNQVSIGVAYNGSSIYLTEDFLDNYISWSGNTPAYGGSEMYLNGSILPGYGIYQVYISYDPSLQNLSVQTVPSGPYGYGTDVAGVVSSKLYYYKNISTLVADEYSTNANHFAIDFNLGTLINTYGAGEYTTMLILNNTLDKNLSTKSFIGSTYTVFINRQGNQYIPKYV